MFRVKFSCNSDTPNVVTVTFCICIRTSDGSVSSASPTSEERLPFSGHQNLLMSTGDRTRGFHEKGRIWLMKNISQIACRAK